MMGRKSNPGGPKPLLLLLAMVLFWGEGAFAFTQHFVLQKCALISEDSQRLACYDSVAESFGLLIPESDGTLNTTQERYGGWTVRTEAENSETPPSVYTYLFSRSLLHGSDGSPVTPIMVARCHEGITEFFLAFPPSLKLQSDLLQMPVLYSHVQNENVEKRSGKKTIVIGQSENSSEEAKRKKAKLVFEDGRKLDLSLTHSSDGLAWFFPNPVSIIRQISRHDRVTITPTEAVPGSSEILFELERMEEAILPLRRACTW